MVSRRVRNSAASSEMSLVAVVERADDQPGSLPKTRIVPVGMAQNTSFRSYFSSPPACRSGMSSPLTRLSRLSSKSFATALRAASGADRPSIAEGRARFPLSRARTQGDLLPLIRELIRIIEQYLVTGRNKEATRYAGALLGILNSVRSRLTTQAHKRALKIVTDYLTSDLNRSKWSAVRKQLEATWPLLRTTASQAFANQSTSGSLTKHGIKAGTRQEEALRTFEKSVNQREPCSARITRSRRSFNSCGLC